MNYSSLNYDGEPNEWEMFNTIGSNNTRPENIKNNLTEEPIQIRDNLLNILNNKDILPIDDPEFKDEEIDNIILKLKEFTKNFNSLQEDLDEAHNKYLAYLKNTQENIKKINNSIQLIETCNKEYESDVKVKSIIDPLLEYIKSIDKNDKLNEYKNEYIKRRKLFNKHLYLINTINNWNTSAICPICLTNKIDSYCNPCGHTTCRKCLDKMSNVVNNINHNKCPICRDHIMDIRKLFFI